MPQQPPQVFATASAIDPCGGDLTGAVSGNQVYATASAADVCISVRDATTSPAAPPASPYGALATIPLLAGAFADFTVSDAGYAATTGTRDVNVTGTDPGYSLRTASNTGANSGASSAVWTRLYYGFTLPAYLPQTPAAPPWAIPAYLDVGARLGSMPGGTAQLLDQVQVEVIPIGTLAAPGSVASPPTPSAYTHPQTVTIQAAPDRINFCPNPSFEVSAANWTVSGLTFTQAPQPAVIPGVVNAGTNAGQIQLTNPVGGALSPSGASVSCTLAGLLPGESYTASGYYYPGADMSSLQVAFTGGLATSALNLSSGNTATPYGSGPYGSGPFGGGASGDLPQAMWTRWWVTFTAQATSVTLAVIPTPTVNATTATQAWLDAVMVEPGVELGDYFDGATGSDYMWQFGGTTGLCPSFYYLSKLRRPGWLAAIAPDWLPYGCQVSEIGFGQIPIQ